MSIRENFIVPKRYNTLAFVLMAIGIISIIALYISTHGNGEHQETQDARFWASLIQNSVYFLLVVNAAMFFICATTLAWGGWQMSFRRVTEAISACVPVLGVICGVILIAVIAGGKHAIYHWNVPKEELDDVLEHKSGFLNAGFFITVTILTIVLWSLLGWKMRKMSRELDNNPLKTIDEKKKYLWKNTVWAAIYIVVFSLTVMSSLPWLWLMSIDAHWYSTMYSRYTFASTFVAGMALIAMFIIFLKNNGYLEYTNSEHLHDVGKFMFAFSIFWTYLWFSHFILIWYANIPEETTYFKPRAEGVYSGIFWIMFMINFLAPLLILMTRDAKRKYTVMAFMAVLIIFGHWLDLYQMVMPGPLKDHETHATYVPMILYDFGVAIGFVGLIIFLVGRALTKAPLLAKNHPFIKESLIHHT